MTVAIKTIKKYESEKEANDFFREMDIMSRLVHPNIIKLYGIVQQGVQKRKCYNTYDTLYI